MTALRTGPHGRRLLWAAALALAASQAIAQQATTIPPGFDSVPRPPGQVGGSQGFRPPGGQSGVLAPPPAANPTPLELSPPPTRPVSLPTPQGPTLQSVPPAA